MKKHIIYGLAVLLSFNITSCDILDVNPVDSFTDAAVWGDLALAETYLNNSYTKMLADNQKGSRYASFTDEIFQMHLYGTDNVRQGYLSPDISGFGWEDDMWNAWNYFYSAIKDVNLFHEKIDDVPVSTDREATWKNELKGQGYFFRAYFYHQLYSIYGRIPLITETYALETEEFTETRAPLEEVSKYITDQCDSAAKYLPVVYSNGSDFGRVTKGAALAIKARTLLYAASPLFGTPSAEKWQKASDAQRAVIDLKTESGALAYTLKHVNSSEEYMNLFLDTENPEIIMLKMFDTKRAAGSNSSFLHQAPCGPGSGFANGWGTLQPTQEIVDKFQLADGTPYIIPEGELDFNPWEGRDLRLHATIFIDGSRWGYGEDNREIEFFVAGEKDVVAGKDSREGADWWNATRTGYGMKKFLDPNFDTSGTLANTAPWIFLRLAEFYLNYAECQIQLGNKAEALEYINKVRTRVNMPDVPGVDIWAEYENERQVELVFEGQRWFDIRRWMTAEKEYNTKPITGIDIRKYQDGSKRYERIAEPVETRKFYAPKNYWMPIPRSELRKAPQIDAQPYE